ncbi:unnamed protein product [Prorocentrum cordatum]|nr:unnamed protein product [Polarella glacialis]
MQLLSHCAQTNSDRPFYTGMARLCKEFHKRTDGLEPLNVLVMTQVTEIISTWQSLGSADAGEFLFYMLNGMHEECKWKAKSGSAEGQPGAEDGGCAQVRAAGVHEDSPIVRIFGGLIRSSVRSQSATA